ncbi:MAG: YfcE family phosphodiesterase [Clostridia bacterium]|nr:YfcE family phosphodiesterase [Clostridia bacterium]
MKTITVFSDVHYSRIPERLINVADESSYCFFLGDGIHSLGNMILHKEFHAVQGNCDDYCGFPEEEVIEVEKVKILITHGNKYHVKRDLLPLLYRAKELECSLVFYGHTHFAEENVIDGITLINPGAIESPGTGVPSYCYAVIEGEKIVTKIVNLN